MSQTLRGIHVVSTAVNVPGPVAVGSLRDLGATVVKIEPPGGDPLSSLAPAWYASLCGGIEVMRLDLKSDDGRGAADDLLTRADLLVTSSRPSSLQRLGLSTRDLRDRHRRLCHVAIVGYPDPDQEVAGHDLTYQAASGLLNPPAMPRTLIADLSGAQRVVIAALDLLFARERRGDGGYVEVALADCASLFAEPIRYGLTTSTGALGGAYAGYNIFPARDGWVAVAALEPQFRAVLARDLGVAVEDRAALTRVLSERPAVEWERWANARDLPVVAVRHQPGVPMPAG
jgi:crotonobetainyl-CoA:carnitine CoA-transferase CaiB-like acyl-CoA transferase